MRYLLFLVAFAISTTGFAQSLEVAQNLQSRWQVYDGKQYVPYAGQSGIITLHLSLTAREARGQKLAITTQHPVAVFAHDVFLKNLHGTSVLDVDSLRRVLQRQAFQLSFHGAIAPHQFSTTLVRPVLTQAGAVHQPRPSDFFRDFVLTVSFVVLVLLVTIIRLNPKLASDYFSVTKIFSLRESEDNVLYTRVTSSGNFLFYGFSSLTVGFLLVLCLAYLPQRVALRADSYQEIMLKWLLISAVVGAIFMGKMVVVYLFATLFKLREVAGMQFFNWVRLLFFMVGFSLIVIVLFVQARSPMQSIVYFFYTAGSWLLVAWVVLAFFKVAAKARIGLFHLFSYLCATEIIPSLIILKILYY